MGSRLPPNLKIEFDGGSVWPRYHAVKALELDAERLDRGSRSASSMEGKDREGTHRERWGTAV